jgi:hypothetical protein
MLLTEEEAKRKDCCTKTPEEFVHCQASNCMAWRWIEDSKWLNLDRKAKIDLKRQENWLGYCGLAGGVE